MIMPHKHVFKQRWAWDKNLNQGKGAWFNVCSGCGLQVIKKQPKSQNPN